MAVMQSDKLEIFIDQENNFVRIRGVSYPEDAVVLYMPVIEWIETKKPGEENLDIEFFFEFLNSVSNKMVFEILNRLKIYQKNGGQVNIKWMYLDGDDDMEEIGNDLQNLVRIKMDLIVIPDNE